MIIKLAWSQFIFTSWVVKKLTRRKIVEVILLNFRLRLGNMDKLEIIYYHCNYL